MKLLVIGINYFPEQTSVAPFTTGLCEHLVELGHSVLVITAFPYTPYWRIYKEYRGLVYKHEQIRGVDVRRVIHFIPSKPRNLVQRLLHDITFSFNAMFAIATVGSFDGIFCSSPPPFVPTVAWMASHIMGVPFAMQLTDLASDAASALGIMRYQGGLSHLAQVIENFNYQRAAGISVLCSGFKDRLVNRGVSASKIHIVPVWADTETIRPLERENIFRSQNNLDKKEYVALHAGNMGLKQGLKTVVEAARLTEMKPTKIRWMLAGDGEERGQLLDLASHYDLSKLMILPLQPKETLPFMLAAADVLLLIQKASVTDMVIPSKLLTYMAAARPVIASVNFESETARLIRDADCGLIIPPENPRMLSEAVENLCSAPKEAARLGQNGRNHVEKYFAKESVLGLYDIFLQSVFPDSAQTKN